MTWICSKGVLLSALGVLDSHNLFIYHHLLTGIHYNVLLKAMFSLWTWSIVWQFNAKSSFYWKRPRSFFWIIGLVGLLILFIMASFTVLMVLEAKGIEHNVTNRLVRKLRHSPCTDVSLPKNTCLIS